MNIKDNSFSPNLFSKVSWFLVAVGSMVFSVIAWSDTAGNNEIYAFVLGFTIIGLEIAKPLRVRAAVLAGRNKMMGSQFVNFSASAGLVIASLIATIMFITSSNQNSQAILSKSDPVVSANYEQIARLSENVANMPENYVTAKRQAMEEISELQASNAEILSATAVGQVTPLNAISDLVSKFFDGDIRSSTVILVLSLFIACLIELALVAVGFSLADEVSIKADDQNSYRIREKKTQTNDKESFADKVTSGVNNFVETLENPISFGNDRVVAGFSSAISSGGQNKINDDVTLSDYVTALWSTAKQKNVKGRSYLVFDGYSKIGDSLGISSRQAKSFHNFIKTNKCKLTTVDSRNNITRAKNKNMDVGSALGVLEANGFSGFTTKDCC